MQNLTNISVIKKLAEKYGFSFSKSLGQNFIVNPGICPKIAENISTANVLEIGPGIGVLTTEIAKKAKKVTAVEIDKTLLPVLDETLKQFDNVEIINGDFLNLDLKQLINTRFCDEKVTVCANLPYYITTPIIMKILEEGVNIDSLILMVQKEMAQRITCSIPSREMGSISLAIRYYSDPQILFGVSKGSFYPAPNVDSAVIKLSVREHPPEAVTDKEAFFRVVRAAFSQRRKTLANSLSAGLNIDKSAVLEAAAELGLSPSVRPEQLSFKDYAGISRLVC